MSEAKPKRPWFQFHLSTIMVLTVITAGMCYFDIEMWNSVAEQSNIPGVPWFGVITLLTIELGILAGVAYLL